MRIFVAGFVHLSILSKNKLCILKELCLLIWPKENIGIKLNEVLQSLGDTTQLIKLGL